MRRAQGFVAIWLIAGLTMLPACTQPPSSANPAAPIGQASQDASSLPAPSNQPIAKGTVDPAKSRGLTDYLKAHQLPLVGAQVINTPDNQHEVILFGYAATDYGRSDAEQKTRKYLSGQTLVIANRITVNPDIAGSAGSMTPTPPAGTTSTKTDSGDVGDVGSAQDYQNQADPYAQGQPGSHMMGGTMSFGGGSGGSMMGLMGLFLGAMGGGGSGFGGGFGGGGYGPGYGNPYGGGYGGGYPPPGYGYPPPYQPYP